VSIALNLEEFFIARRAQAGGRSGWSQPISLVVRPHRQRNDVSRGGLSHRPRAAKQAADRLTREAISRTRCGGIGTDMPP